MKYSFSKNMTNGIGSNSWWKNNKSTLIIIGVGIIAFPFIKWFANLIKRLFDNEKSKHEQEKLVDELAEGYIADLNFDYNNTTISAGTAKGIAQDLIQAFNCPFYECADGTDGSKIQSALRISDYQYSKEWYQNQAKKCYEEGTSFPSVDGTDSYVFDYREYNFWGNKKVYTSETEFTKEDILLIIKEFGTPVEQGGSTPTYIGSAGAAIGLWESQKRTLKGWIYAEMDVDPTSVTNLGAMLIKLIEWAETAKQ